MGTMISAGTLENSPDAASEETRTGIALQAPPPPLAAADMPAPVQGKGPLRLAGLDGIRGLAALYVVLFHAKETFSHQHISLFASPLLEKFAKIFSYGHYAVVLFIVLSGFSLALPVAQTADQSLKGGWRGFLKRRARRILPPYYAALAVSLALITLFPCLQTRNGSFWDVSLPVWKFDIIFSHLLLIHNLNPSWQNKIDYPLWTVAAEWQIYFLFPLALLPLWRRYGIWFAVSVAVIVSIVPHFISPMWGYRVCPQLIGMFAFGVTSAFISTSQESGIQRIRTRAPWFTLSAMLFVVVYLIDRNPAIMTRVSFVSDFPAGLASGCLLIGLARSGGGKSSSPLRVQTLLESRFSRGLGQFSYSLYLIHAPILALVWSTLRAANSALSAPACLLLMLTVGTLLSVIGAYLFYLCFERPFTKALRVVPPTNE